MHHMRARLHMYRSRIWCVDASAVRPSHTRTELIGVGCPREGDEKKWRENKKTGDEEEDAEEERVFCLSTVAAVDIVVLVATVRILRGGDRTKASEEVCALGGLSKD